MLPQAMLLSTGVHMFIYSPSPHTVTTYTNTHIHLNINNTHTFIYTHAYTFRKDKLKDFHLDTTQLSRFSFNTGSHTSHTALKSYN